MPPSTERSKDHAGSDGRGNLNPGWWMRLVVGAAVSVITFVLAAHTFLSVDANQRKLLQSIRQQEAGQAAHTEPADSYDENTLKSYVGDSNQVALGSELFALYCTDCHGEHGEGSSGPDLTDTTWTHGGTHVDVFNAITHGVPNNGMPAWGETLALEERAQLVAFIRSIQPGS